ncbi:glycoside hydrolase family 15 protein [Microcella sp.]|uniref:glycoside hydrolase family 15 protein n=1 Tax=Microcella sp. TaxID=1913979 RepID=UPI00391ADBDE
MSGERYAPIEDYAAIGNLRTVALVGRSGAIDWLPLPGLESASVFAALLDHDRGGRFRVHADGIERGEQRYIEHTNVLETVFADGDARLTVTDVMPLSGTLDGVGDSSAEPAVHRLVRADGGSVDVIVEWSPRFSYGAGLPQLTDIDGGVLAWAGDDALTLSGLRPGEWHIDTRGHAATLTARLTLADGEQRALVTRWGAQLEVDRGEETTQRVIDDAVDAWRSWVHKAEASGTREWAAPHEELIIRSELALKLLTHGETGAIAGAATTSLPEEIGGVRNWDYRFAWIRDAALAAQALRALGHTADAQAFVAWAERSAREHREDERSIQLVYGLNGETEIGEREVPGLEGYRRSAPVRVGNGAVDQLQLDVFGELIAVVYELARADAPISDEILAFLPSVADEACRSWEERDDGLWELRTGPFHIVYSKVKVWAGLNRAIELANAGYIDGDAERWRKNRELIREEVLERGFDPEVGAFRQSYERSVLDASHLLLPLREFLPPDDARVRANLDATFEGLVEEGLVHRYRADDGIAGSEGAFGLCTFWLVDALAMDGREGSLDRAREIFEGMAARANHVGLYSEEIDPETGEFLGNFPQAFTHLGLITSALYLAYAEGRDSPVPDPIGTPEHRQRGLTPR